MRRGDFAGRTDLRLRSVFAVGAVIVICVAAVLSTGELVMDLRSPAGVCERELEWFEGLVVSKAHRQWPPPLVRCDVSDTDPGQESYRGSVSGLTATHLAIVIVLDLTVIAFILGGTVHWRRRTRTTEGL